MLSNICLVRDFIYRCVAFRVQTYTQQCGLGCDQIWHPAAAPAPPPQLLLVPQGFRLISLSAHVPYSTDSAGSKLLLSLPLPHLTALHLTGRWALPDAAAAALTAATSLRDLTLSGVGLGEALAAHSGDLSPRLHSLCLTDAGACSAATLRALSEQLSALTHLTLDYNALSDGEVDSPGMVTSPTNSNHSLIDPEVQDCWAGLSALRSLHIGSRKIPQEYGLDIEDELLGDHHSQEPSERSYLAVDCHLIKSIAALTRLTSLTLGPSAWLDNEAAEGGVEPCREMVQLRKLTGLQQLVLTLQVGRQCSIAIAVSMLPCPALVNVSRTM